MEILYLLEMYNQSCMKIYFDLFPIGGCKVFPKFTSTKLCVTYLPQLVFVAWFSPDQTHDKQQHRTTAYRKHRVETNHPSVVMATCYKHIQLITTPRHTKNATI